MKPTSKDMCSNCTAFVMDPGRADQGVCRARPPTPLVLGMQQMPGNVIAHRGQGGPAVMPIIQGVFPPMKATSWCREYERADETVANTGT